MLILICCSSLGPLVGKVKEYHIESIIDNLCQNMLSTNEQLRDISSIGEAQICIDNTLRATYSLCYGGYDHLLFFIPLESNVPKSLEMSQTEVTELIDSVTRKNSVLSIYLALSLGQGDHMFSI